MMKRQNVYTEIEVSAKDLVPELNRRLLLETNTENVLWVDDLSITDVRFAKKKGISDVLKKIKAWIMRISKNK